MAKLDELVLASLARTMEQIDGRSASRGMYATDLRDIQRSGKTTLSLTQPDFAFVAWVRAIDGSGDSEHAKRVKTRDGLFAAWSDYSVLTYERSMTGRATVIFDNKMLAAEPVALSKKGTEVPALAIRYADLRGRIHVGVAARRWAHFNLDAASVVRDQVLHLIG